MPKAKFCRYNGRVKSNKAQIFTQTIRDFYHKNKRDLPWRKNITSYSTVVSEIMLQQTQVSRVQVKFPVFINRYPTFQSLAQATNKDILSSWQGMGYNRRALYLRDIAKKVIDEYKGELPNDEHILDTFPGIGYATACSIVAFAFNKPLVFIETNIRRVFIHHFFQDKTEIPDTDLMPLVEKTLDKQKPREWYFALMDYGSYLAKIVDNPNKKSKHYTKQSRFIGSDREIRGKVLRLLLKEENKGNRGDWGDKGRRRIREIGEILGVEEQRLEKILDAMVREKILRKKKEQYYV